MIGAKREMGPRQFIILEMIGITEREVGPPTIHNLELIGILKNRHLRMLAFRNDRHLQFE